MKHRIVIITLFALLMVKYVHADEASDLELALKFSPILILTEETGDEHGWEREDMRVIKPEPVEIVSAQSADSIRFGVYDLAGKKRGISDWRSLFLNTQINVDYVDFSQNHFAFLPSLFTAINPSGYIPRTYLIKPHFDYPGEGPTEWNATYFGEGDKAGINFANTAYVHIYEDTEEVLGNITVIQYFYFYPYNHWWNRHEGDWQRVHVVVNSRTPATAEVIGVEYLAHKGHLSYYNDYPYQYNEFGQQVDNSDNYYPDLTTYFVFNPQVDLKLSQGTHPIIYVGAGSHAAFPTGGRIRTWNFGTSDRYESMTHTGLVLSTQADNFHNDLWESYDLVLLGCTGVTDALPEPNPSNINNKGLLGSQSWLGSDVVWGTPSVASPHSDIGFTILGNNSPSGPYHEGWEDLKFFSLSTTGGRPVIHAFTHSELTHSYHHWSIIGNEIWNETASTTDDTVSLRGDIVIFPGATLTINAATIVEFEPENDRHKFSLPESVADETRAEIFVYGTLITNGTVADSVRFQKKSDSAWSGDYAWGGIRVMPGGSVDLNHTSIRDMSPPPAPPTDLTAQAGDEEATLAWVLPEVNDPTITGWTYRAGTISGADTTWADWQNISNTATTSHLVENLTNGTAYTFQVAAVNPAGRGPTSDSSAAVAPAGPPEPPELTVAAGHERVRVRWSPRANNGSPIEQHEWRYSADGGTTWSPNQTVYGTGEQIVQNLDNDTTYTFQMKSRNGIGYSEVVEVQATPRNPIKGPTAISFAENSDDPVASYRFAPAELDQSLVDYRLHLSDVAGFDSGLFELNSQGELRFRNAPDFETPADADGNNIYTVRLRAAPVSGNGGSTPRSEPALPFTKQVEVTVTDADDPGVIVLSPLTPQVGVPFTAELTDQDGSITGASWQWQGQEPGTTTWQTLAGTSSESQSQSSSSSRSSRSSSSSQPYPALSSYTPQVAQMGWTLRAVVNTYRDAFGAGKTAESLATAPVQAGVPTAPENLSAAPSDQSVQLTWEAPTSNGGAEITGYTYRYSPDGGTTWLPSEQGTTVEETTLYVQQTIGDLINGTEYTFQVWANNPDIGAVAQETTTPGVVPPAPRLVRAEASQSSIRLGWTQVSATPKVLGHQVRYQRQPAQPGLADWSEVDYVDLATLDHPRTRYSTLRDAEDYPLHPGHRYRYQVRARNGVGYGAWSELFPVNGVIVQVVAPRLAGLALADESVGLTATWTCPNYGLCAPAPPDWPVAALRLTTQYKSGLSASWSVGSAQVASGAGNQVVTTHRVSGLSRRVVHQFRTRAVNANGLASWASPSVALVPLRAQPVSSTDQVSLSWDRPVGYGGLAWQYRYKASANTTWEPWRSVSTSGATAQTVSGLTNGVRYQFQVQAVSGGMARVVSFIESATPGGVVPPPATTVSLGSDSYEALEGDAAVSITVVLSQVATQAVDIPVSVSPATGTHADDYTVTGLTAGMVSFVAGEWLQSFEITANEDADTTADSVRVSLGTPPAGMSRGQPSQATVTLLDNDDPTNPSGSVWLSSSSPQVGRQLTATVMDPSGNISGTSWQWQRRPDDSSPWQPAGGASWSVHTTVSIYIPAASDENHQLQATVRYDDAQSSGQTAQSDPTHAVTRTMTVVVNPSGSVSLSSSSPQVGRQLTATLTDDSGRIGGTSWQWQRRPNDSSPWQPAAGASSALHTTVAIYWPDDSDANHQLQVIARYDDAHGRGQTAQSTVTHAVTRTTTVVVNPSGSVSLSSPSPRVGRQLTATLTDRSGGISGATWQWQRRSGTRAWESATGTWSQPYPWISIYQPPSGDVGYLLRATVRYDDTHSRGQTAQSTPTDAVRPAPPPPPPPPSDEGPVVSGGSITCYVGEYCSYTFSPASRGTEPISYTVSPPSWATASGRSFSGTAPSSFPAPPPAVRAPTRPKRQQCLWHRLSERDH